MELRPYIAGDIESLSLREDAPPIVSDVAWTICRGEQPVAVFSIVPFFTGTGHIVGFVDKSAVASPLSFTRAAKRLFRASLDMCPQYHRIQAFVFSSRNAKWAEVMGLEYEATLAKASPDGSDIQVYRFLR